MAAARKVSPAASITLRPSAREFRGELADGGGLAGAVDADHEDDERLLRRVDLKRLCHRRQHLFDFGRDHGFDLIGRDRLVVAPGADGIGNAPATSVPRSARSSTSSISSSMARSSLRLVTRSATAVPSELEVRFRPPVSRCHQLRLGASAGGIVHGGVC